MDEVLAQGGVQQYTLHEYTPTRLDRLLGWLMNPVVQGIFVMMIVGGIYFELQTPGIGFALVVAILGAVLYFAPLYIEGVAQNWELILFIIGLALLAVEIFVLPGFGIAGVAGSGQRELLESIAGLYPVAEGSSIRYTPEGAPESELVGKTPMQIKKSGVALAFVPEDRLGMGLVGSMGMTGNMMLRSWKKGKGVFVNRKDPNELALNIWKELEVVTPSTEFPVRRMSGGNVQKVLVGREIASAPNVLMSAYAVRGLDINTSYTIYNLMTEQKMKGVAVIFVGEDLDVLLELCDRILVLCGGKVSGIVDARTATKEEIGLMMTRVGGGKEEAVHA